MIIIIPEDFDISKAYQVLDTYSNNRELKKALFVHDLINQQEYQAPKSILYQDTMIKKLYTEDLIKSVLNDLGYCLLFYQSYKEFGPGAKFSVIAFGPVEG